MFSKPPAYTTQDLDSAVKRLSDLEHLQDSVLQKIRLYSNNQPGLTQELQQRYDRYDADIKSAQLRLDYMQREGLPK